MRYTCVAVCCSVLQCVAVCCSVLQCIAVYCSVLRCVAVCCSVFESRPTHKWGKRVLQCVEVCCHAAHVNASCHTHEWATTAAVEDVRVNVCVCACVRVCLYVCACVRVRVSVRMLTKGRMPCLSHTHGTHMSVWHIQSCIHESFTCNDVSFT